MKPNNSLEIFCSALEMKARKRDLYESAMKACPDQVGKETFRMLRDAEVEGVKQLREVYEELKKGNVAPDACRLVSFEGEDTRHFLKNLAAEQKKISQACSDDVAAIESGLKLEDASVKLFDEQLKTATEPALRSLLERVISEERKHYIMLADLKFYYVDTGNWFLEKGKQGLDGAGAVT